MPVARAVANGHLKGAVVPILQQIEQFETPPSVNWLWPLSSAAQSLRGDNLIGVTHGRRLDVAGWLAAAAAAGQTRARRCLVVVVVNVPRRD